MSEQISHLVSLYGYWIVSLLILLESAGLPLPGETALIVASAYAGAGKLSIFSVILFAAMAAIIGDAGGYWVGRLAGRRLLTLLRIKDEKLRRIESFFQKHGPKTVFFGRFISILRTYSALFAGISRMPYVAFTAYNATGGIIWALTFGILGYAFGKNLPQLEQIVHQVGMSILIVFVLILSGILFWRWISGKEQALRIFMVQVMERPSVGRFRDRYHSQIAWIRRRLSADQYLGLHFTVGLVFAGAFLWIFAGVTQDILAQDPLVRVDQQVALTLRSWSTPTATLIFQFISYLGNPVVLAISVLICVLFDRIWRALELVAWTIAIVGGEILEHLLVHLIGRFRNTGLSEFPSQFNFPSGHAMLSVIVYGLVTYFEVLSLQSWNARVRAICAGIILILMIGFSRLYLGTHYLSDVLAGFAAGGLWLTFCITAIELARRDEIHVPWIDRINAWISS